MTGLRCLGQKKLLISQDILLTALEKIYRETKSILQDKGPFQ